MPVIIFCDRPSAVVYCRKLFSFISCAHTQAGRINSNDRINNCSCFISSPGRFVIIKVRIGYAQKIYRTPVSKRKPPLGNPEQPFIREKMQQEKTACQNIFFGFSRSESNNDRLEKANTGRRCCFYICLPVESCRGWKRFTR